MKKILILTSLAMALISQEAFALNLQRLFQDIKLPTQAQLEHQTITAPAVNGTTQVLNAQLVNQAIKTVSSFSAQPDVPRNLVITPGASSANVPASTITVNGTDIFSASISESFSLSSAQSTAVTGSKAFKTVSSIVFPAMNSTGETFSVGYGTKLGLKRCMAKNGDIAWAELGGAYEATHPTGVASTAVSGNTAALSSSLNGSDVDVYFVQNFTCLP